MNTPEKDPNLIRDDDHLDRKDITEKEFDDECQGLIAKHGKKKDKSKPSDFSKATIDALNFIQQ